MKEKNIQHSLKYSRLFIFLKNMVYLEGEINIYKRVLILLKKYIYI